MSDELLEPGHSKTRLRRTGRGTNSQGDAGDTTPAEQDFLMGEADEAVPQPEAEQSDQE